MKSFGEQMANTQMEATSKDIQIGCITSTSEGGKKINMSISGDSEARDLQCAYPYGYATVPPQGLVSFATLSDDEDGVFGTIDPDRPSVKSGEVLLYSKSGAQILLDADGNIKIECIQFDITGASNFVGDLEVSGDTINLHTTNGDIKLQITTSGINITGASNFIGDFNIKYGNTDVFKITNDEIEMNCSKWTVNGQEMPY